ncbi:MAG TPA: FAD-dependent oxidoreductase [Candidatus Binatia bacterium]|nr:FAD-dependent oxidoreductase [Candidatus Binatia bacterium]
MDAYEFVIIGAGFAGAATAYHLTRRGITSVVILEQESIPGFHSSGRNAAMMRQCVPDPDLAKLTRDGAAFLRHPPSDWPESLQFKQNGSLLLGSGAGWSKLQRDAEEGRRVGIDVELWTPEQAKRQVPVLQQAEFEGAVWCASDGIIDIHALLSGYLKGATGGGARVRYNAAVRAIHRQNGAFEIVTAADRIKAENIVNASGAWANVVAGMADVRTLPLRPCRRHLFVSPPMAWVDARWPFVWDVSHDIYFRPEGEGLLLCACDQTELAPGDPPVDESVKELLAEKIDKFMPGLSRVSINKGWAGMRTLTPDGRFVIGWDGRVKNFFWVAGLGGHGMTTSSAVGSLAAELLIGEPSHIAAPFSPERFSS